MRTTWLSGILNKYSAPAPPPRSGRVPTGNLIYAIGDIHGRADLLDELVQQILADAQFWQGEKKPTLVFLGDYVDRGPNSKGVIDYLISGALEPFETVFLKGNHEEMLLDFIEDDAVGPLWLANGGAETLRAYGIRPPVAAPDRDEWRTMRDDFSGKISGSHLAFLRALATYAIYGDYIFVHAGLRPGRPIESQDPKDYLWIRDEFTKAVEPLAKIVVHGHSLETEPHRSSRRIGIDTGACYTGKLTAARFMEEGVTFLQTGRKTGHQSAQVINHDRP